MFWRKCTLVAIPYSFIAFHAFIQEVDAAAFPGITAAPVLRAHKIPGYVVGYYPVGTGCKIA
jgi:hypothetical protein